MLKSYINIWGIKRYLLQVAFFSFPYMDVFVYRIKQVETLSGAMYMIFHTFTLKNHILKWIVEFGKRRRMKSTKGIKAFDKACDEVLDKDSNEVLLGGLR